MWVLPRDDCVWGLYPVPKVFQECGSPQPARARARRAPAPREDVGRFWSAAVAEEERPTSAAGASLPRLVSGGRPRQGRERGGQGRALHLRPAGSLYVQVWELRERLGRVRGIWAGLPQTVCGDPRVAADLSQEAAPCWTGAGPGR